jgi:hypothetical protein
LEVSDKERRVGRSKERQVSKKAEDIKVPENARAKIDKNSG